MTVMLYHNPRCATSRRTLALLQARGIEPRIIEYLKTPPDAGEIATLLGKLGLTPHQLLRAKEARAAGIDPARLDGAALIAAMARNPITIERPIVVNGAKAALGRPPEAALAIL